MKMDRKTCIKGASLALIIALLGYLFLIVKAKGEMGGASPDRRVLGSTLDISQRAMEQYATGVLVTPEATWLVGRREGSIQEFAFAGKLPDPSKLLSRGGSQDSALSMFGFSSRPTVSFISRLNASGSFEPIAVVPGVSRLTATPDGKRVFLLTDLEPADKSYGDDPKQFVIFQSDDQGRTWQYRKEGLFPAINFISWNLNLYFHDSRSFWSWKDRPYVIKEDSEKPPPPGLQFSPDGGDHVENVDIDGFKPISLDDVRSSAPTDASWGEANGNFGSNIESFVTQLDLETAVIWVSQTFSYKLGGGPVYTNSLKYTYRLLLKRKANDWRLEGIQRQDGFTISKLQDNHAGRVVAVVETDKGTSTQVAILDKDRLTWDIQGKLPGAFGFLTSGTRVRDLYVGNGVVVASVISHHQVPRWLYPWGSTPATIDADAVFYSSNWGKTWRKLSIDGYLGILGMDTKENRVIFAKGNWYESEDPRVYSYGLK